MGRAFNKTVQLLAVRGLQDTQCGFKCFSAAAANELFPLQRTTGWGFDVSCCISRASVRCVSWRYR